MANDSFFDCKWARVGRPRVKREVFRYLWKGVTASTTALDLPPPGVKNDGKRFARVHISPARGPPLWDGCDAQVDDAAQSEPDWDLAAQPAPGYELDQRINW